MPRVNPRITLSKSPRFIPGYEKRDLRGSTTTLRGSTSHPATLLFICSDGSTIQTRSQAFSKGLYFFEVRLPRRSPCRLWIKREDSTFRQVSFRIPQKRPVPLLCLDEEILDLGHLFIGQNDALIVDLDPAFWN